MGLNKCTFFLRVFQIQLTDDIPSEISDYSLHPREPGMQAWFAPGGK
jgi:hypothetical protein